ncbi:MAG: PAS domain S-box protein [Phycisphaerae bacterium]
MPKRSENKSDRWSQLRDKIIGLGETSSRKNYYPQLQAKLQDLERFRSLLDQSNDAIVFANLPSLRIADFNKRVPAILGKTPEELSGSSVRDHLCADGRTVLDDWLEATELTPGESLTFETRLLGEDQQELLYEVTANVVEFDQNRYAVIVMRDLAERTQAEQELRQSEERFRDLLNQAADAIYVHDREGRFLTVNENTCKLLGYSREELLSMSVADINREFSWESLSNLWEDTAEWGAITAETVHVRKDGQEVPVEVRVGTIQSGDQRVMLTIARDIRPRKEAQQELQHERDFANNLLETAQTIVFVLTDDLRVERMNRFARWTTGYDEQQVYGQPWLELLPEGSTRAEAEQLLRRALKEESIETIECTTQNSSGNELVVRWSFSPVVEARRTRGVLVVGHDMTEVREKELQLRQAQKMEAIGRLAGGIAHDFNNQLTVVKGYADLLLRQIPKDDPNFGAIQEMQNAARRSAALVDQLLSFSRKQMLKPQSISPNTVLKSMRDPLQRMIGEDVELEFDLDRTTSFVRADPSQFEQALVNLAVNARDAMPQGGTMRFRTRNVHLKGKRFAHGTGTLSGDFVCIAAADTGVGMDQETQQQVFDPFFTTKPVGKGTGLGLAMVFGFVTQSGGNIEVHSRSGKGTEFELYLPQSQATEKPTATRREEPAATLGGNETVLVVEDDEAVRRLVVRVLRNIGYTVLETGNAREAMPLGEHYDDRIDLLVTDVVMPGMNGIQLSKVLRTVRPEMRVLLITGYANRKEGISESIPADADLLVKPFTPQLLADKVREILDKE